MIEWWTSQQSGLIGGIGGSAIGILGGTLGALGGVCAPRGRSKRLVVGFHLLLIAIGVSCLAGGIVALSIRQPYHVYYPLLLCGAILTLVLGSLLPVLLARYRDAERRRLEAESLRRS